MVLVLLIPLRKLCHLEKSSRPGTWTSICKLTLAQQPGHRLHLPDGIFHRVV
jgi:hypothetical protein